MRPQGRVHAGFYPLPPGAVDTALMYLHAENPEGVIAIDPCVGEGLAFKQLLEGLGVPLKNACAVELTPNRGEEAAKNLPEANVLYPADFLGGVNRPARSFSFVYCNPPFDDEIGGGYRVEASFSEKVAHLLRIDGVALFVVPGSIWKDNPSFREALARSFVEVMAVEPAEEDRPYNEILVFGVRRDNTVQDWSGKPVMQMKTETDEPYLIPTLKNPCYTLRKTQMTEAELKSYLINSPLESMVDVPNPIQRGRPPLALGEGHNSLLVASGQSPPIVAMRDSKGRLLEVPHLVRGVSKKAQILKEQEEDVNEKGESFTKDVYTEIFILVMTVLLHTGEIIKLEQGSEEMAQAGKRREAEQPPKPGHQNGKAISVLPAANTKRGSHGGIAI